MSPAPTPEIIDDLYTSNINVDIINAHESDSEDEDVGMTRYMPLSQLPIEGEPLEDDDVDDKDFEWSSAPMESHEYVSESGTVGSEVPPQTLEVWSSLCNPTNIDLDAEKINQVKSVMASFTLPNTAIPEWANFISEEQWKEQLIHRIKEIQKDAK